MPHVRLVPDFTFTTERLDELKQVVPEAFADGKVNWEALREALGKHLEPEEVGAEHFGLFWPGKREARRLASLPSRGTLLPAPGEGVNEDKTRNFFIEGENLEVLKLLQKAYSGRIKLIYIDPPYNTGNDFVYRDNYADPLGDYLKRTGQADESGLLTSNARADGRFHSNWMSMMYPRLRILRTLLSADGLIAVSIDDNEVHHLRAVLDEVFGEECFVSQVVWKSRKFPDSRATTHVSTDHEYVLVYCRMGDGALRGIARDEDKFSNPDSDPRGPWMSRSILGLATAAQRPNLHYPIVHPTKGTRFQPPPNTGWRYSKERMARLIVDGRILFPKASEGRPREKKFRSDMKDDFIAFPSVVDGVHTADGTAEIRDLFGYDAFDFPKPSELIRLLVEQATLSNSIVLDAFGGSGTTAHAVAVQNRRDGGSRSFIVCQAPEPLGSETKAFEHGLKTISEVGQQRIRLAFRSLKKEGKPKSNEDLGFRVLRLAESHYRAWEDYSGDSIEEVQMLFNGIENPLLKGWTTDGLLVEVMLLEGFSLDSVVSELPGAEANTIRVVSSDHCGHRLLLCFDKEVTDATLDAIELQEHDVFVCLDSALSDQAKHRLADRCTLKTI